MGCAVVGSLGAWLLAGFWLRHPGVPGRAVVQAGVDLRVLQETTPVGGVVDHWRGVPVRANGLPYDRSVGSHSSASGYYYGRQWQCVEFVKRYYFDAHGHAMPDVMGHAREFFDPSLEQGGWNAKRGMFQFWNGAGEAPRVDDLMVWNEGPYGHVAVVTRVEENMVEVVQQNVRQGSRQFFTLSREEGFRVGDGKKPAGWLRLPPRSGRDRSTDQTGNGGF